MADYIDREMIKKRLCNNCDWECFFSKCRCLKLEVIDKIPSADVREVKRGVPIPQYITINDYDDASSIKQVYAWRCPFCGSTKIAKFCANCGAEMEMKE